MPSKMLEDEWGIMSSKHVMFNGKYCKAQFCTCTEVAEKRCPHQIVRDVSPKHLLGDPKKGVCILYNRPDLACGEYSISPYKL